LLREGIEVRALVRPGSSVEWPEVECCEGDLTDEASLQRAVEGVQLVVHSAARVATTGTWEEFASANVRGTRRVIAAAVAAGVERIVHISSLGVYAVPRDGITVTEDSAYESEADARGHYSRSKLAADRVALYAAAKGAPVVVLRPGLLYGPGRRPALARQSFTVGPYKLLLARRDYPLPMTHIDNVADAVVLAARSADAVGQPFTVVDDNVPQRDYVQLYREVSGERWRPFYLPVGLVASAAAVAERVFRLARRRPPLTRHQVRRATDRAVFDCARARTVLGWEPAVGLREGLGQALSPTPGAAQ
jgi:nucleoside-diphosphate-sugar epimerase